MCGTFVRYCSSTGMTPRSPTATPAAGRFSFSVLLFRPAATSTASTVKRSSRGQASNRMPGGARGAAFLHLLVPMERDPFAFHGGGQRARNLRVKKWQQHVAAIDHVHVRPEHGKSAGVFAADHPRANDRQSLGQTSPIAGSCPNHRPPAVPKRKDCRAERRGARRDEDALAAEQNLHRRCGRLGQARRRRAGLDVDRVRVHERCRCRNRRRPCARLSCCEIIALKPALTCCSCRRKSATVTSWLQGKVHPIKLACLEPGQCQCGLAQAFCWGPCRC